METTGLEGCNTFSQPGNLFGGLFSAAGSMVISTAVSFVGALAGTGWCWLGTLGSHLFWWDDGGFLWGCYALEHILIREGEVSTHHLLKLYYTLHQKAWFILSRQISLLCPELKGLGVHHCLLMLDLPDISTCKDRVWQWQEIPLAKTWWCW